MSETSAWHWFCDPKTIDHSSYHGQFSPDGIWNGSEWSVSFDFDDLRNEKGESILWGSWHNDSTAGVGVEDVAVARLIAAAPDLLAACVKAEAFDWKSGEGAGDVYETLRAAIAKAKKGQ